MKAREDGDFERFISWQYGEEVLPIGIYTNSSGQKMASFLVYNVETDCHYEASTIPDILYRNLAQWTILAATLEQEGVTLKDSPPANLANAPMLPLV